MALLSNTETNVPVEHIFLLRMAPHLAPYHEWMPEITRKSALLIHKARTSGWGLSQDDLQKLANQYAAVYLIDRYDLTWELDDLVGRLAGSGQIRSLIAQSELDIVRAARLRSRLKIGGQDYESAQIFRDKYCMKNHLASRDVPLPAYHAVHSLADIQDFTDLHGYPVVVKPRLGAGSMGVKVLHNSDDLSAFALSQHAQALLEHTAYMVEKFVPGEMLHIDGLQIDSQVRFMLASEYINGCLAFQEQKFLGSVMLDQEGELAQRVKAMTRHILQNMPLPCNSSFHLELFLTPSGQLVFCEIASRTGGALVPEAIETAVGINSDRVVALAQCEQPVAHLLDSVDSPPRVAGWVLIPPRSAILTSAPLAIECKNVSHYHAPELPKDCTGALHSTDAICSFVVSGASYADARATLIEQVAWVESQMKWAGKPAGTEDEPR
jgi:hypothetical protein